jgi:nicotinamide phosphoribosyltransferase
VTRQHIEFADKFFEKHFGRKNLFNRGGWEYILEKYDGRLPIRIKAVPEGSVIPVKNVLMTVENTDPKCFWLTNYLETLLVQVWYPTTVCGYSHECKKIIADGFIKTSDVPIHEAIGFKLHDFGFRGTSSIETAALGGAAHLVNFLGTDTIAGITLLMEYYGSDVCGYSIPAAEHSTVTSWGRDREAAAYENMLNKFGDGLVAVVSDSYDIYNACKNIWGGELREKVLNMGGCLVIRPDSGNPPDVVCNVLEILGDKFGYSVNKRGFKVLNPKVRIIQGDGISLEMIDTILGRMRILGWSVDNIAFGSGGNLLQKHDRDEQKFAFKCSAVVKNGEVREVFKQPATDPGKHSKKGFLDLIQHEDGTYETLQGVDPSVSHPQSVLRTVFENGKVLVDENLDTIRARVWAQDEV